MGKTTTAINLSAALAEEGKTVLLLDMDPQGNATSGLGVEKNPATGSLYQVMRREQELEEIICSTSISGLDVAPSSTDLASIDIELSTESARESRLKEAIYGVDRYDYIFIDCPPSLGLLSINCLVASSSVIIPIQCEYYALEE